MLHHAMINYNISVLEMFVLHIMVILHIDVQISPIPHQHQYVIPENMTHYLTNKIAQEVFEQYFICCHGNSLQSAVNCYLNVNSHHVQRQLLESVEVHMKNMTAVANDSST